jgi:hypothetical protein
MRDAPRLAELGESVGELVEARADEFSSDGGASLTPRLTPLI